MKYLKKNLPPLRIRNHFLGICSVDLIQQRDLKLGSCFKCLYALRFGQEEKSWAYADFTFQTYKHIASKQFPEAASSDIKPFHSLSFRSHSLHPKMIQAENGLYLSNSVRHVLLFQLIQTAF